MVAAPICIPTNSVGALPFPHTPSGICYLYTIYAGHSDHCVKGNFTVVFLHFSNNYIQILKTSKLRKVGKLAQYPTTNSLW